MQLLVAVPRLWDSELRNERDGCQWTCHYARSVSSVARSNSVLAAAIEIKTPDLQEVSPTKLPWDPSSF